MRRCLDSRAAGAGLLAPGVVFVLMGLREPGYLGTGLPLLALGLAALWPVRARRA